MRPAVSLALACLALAPGRVVAAERPRAAIVVTQAVGVGALADRLGNLAADRVAAGPLVAVGPGEASRLLRERRAPDPMTCGTDAACLRQLGRALEVRWLISVGIGKFGEMYGLEVGAIDLASDAPARSTSSTFAAPGPDWEHALSEALGRVLPAELLATPARIAVRSNVDGAALVLDGKPAGTTPLQSALVLPAGRHALELRKEGYSVSRSELDAAAGSERTIELLLAPIAAPSSGPGLRTWTYVAAGTSAAALVAAIVVHGGASSTMDDARGRKDAGRPFADQRSDALSQMTTARILYGVAGAALAGAATLYFLDTPSTDGAAPIASGGRSR